MLNLLILNNYSYHVRESNDVIIPLASASWSMRSWESDFLDDRMQGAVTSVAFGRRVQKNLAMGYLPVATATSGTRLEISVLGSCFPTEVLAATAYDP